MTDNIQAYSLGSTYLQNTIKQPHDLKTRNMLALRAKLRQKRYHKKIERRKHIHAHLTAALKLSSDIHRLHAQPVYKANIHGLFSLKSDRRTIDNTHGYVLEMRLE